MRRSDSSTGVDPQQALSGRATRQIYMLTAEFLLGMALNLIDMSNRTTRIARTAVSIFLGLHALIAIGLVVGAAFTVRWALKIGPHPSRLAWAGLACIIITFAAGVLTTKLDSDAWSYLMAVGFIASSLVYDALLVQGTSQASSQR